MQHNLFGCYTLINQCLRSLYDTISVCPISRFWIVSFHFLNVLLLFLQIHYDIPAIHSLSYASDLFFEILLNVIVHKSEDPKARLRLYNSTEQFKRLLTIEESAASRDIQMLQLGHF